MGVFATRSPFRPNPIGLSSVKIEKIELKTPQGPVITVRGADLIDGTPIYDIKPYLAFTDSHPDAIGGFADGVASDHLLVQIPEQFSQTLSEPEREALIRILKSDPRPSYQTDPDRVYGFRFSSYEVKFTVRDQVLTVVGMELI